MPGLNRRFYDIFSSNDYPVHRKPLFEEIGKLLDGTVIAYTANPFHPMPMLNQQDIPFFESLLRSSGKSKNGFLMLSSPGGDGNVAEKLIVMLREYFENFTVIIPNYAKSAATMIALGSDKILMGYLAELGPIDPQLILPGYPQPIPARSFIDGLEDIRTRIMVNKEPVEMYAPMLHNIKPEILAMSQAAIDSAKEFAEKYLKKYMLKENPEQASKVAKLLSEGHQYKSHGQVINFEQVRDDLGLNVEMIDPESQLWESIWELYLRSIQFMMQNQAAGAAKLFEGPNLSFVINVQVQIQQIPMRIQPPQNIPLQPPKSARGASNPQNQRDEKNL
ncbi:MAG: hypothetical protein QXW80_05265 [Candidatus Micrarchaeia archaeon]